MNCGTECGCGPEYGRRYLTKDEKIARLKEYHTWLTHEAKGVEEAIQRVATNA